MVHCKQIFVKDIRYVSRLTPFSTESPLVPPISVVKLFYLHLITFEHLSKIKDYICVGINMALSKNIMSTLKYL